MLGIAEKETFKKVKDSLCQVFLLGQRVEKHWEKKHCFIFGFMEQFVENTRNVGG